MHLSSTNSNVTPTPGRGVCPNVMNNLIKLHSQSKEGNNKAADVVLGSRKRPSQVMAAGQTPCLELNEAVRKCYRSLRRACCAPWEFAICWHLKYQQIKTTRSRKPFKWEWITEHLLCLYWGKTLLDSAGIFHSAVQLCLHFSSTKKLSSCSSV